MKTFNDEKDTIFIYHNWRTGIGEGIAVTYAYLKIAEFIRQSFRDKYKIKYHIIPMSPRIENYIDGRDSSVETIESILNKNMIVEYVDEFKILNQNPWRHETLPFLLTKTYSLHEGRTVFSNQADATEEERKNIEFSAKKISLRYICDRHKNLLKEHCHSYSHNGFHHPNTPVFLFGDTVFFENKEGVFDINEDKEKLNQFLLELEVHPRLQGLQHHNGWSSNIEFSSHKIINPQLMDSAIKFCEKNELTPFGFDSVYHRFRQFDMVDLRSGLEEAYLNNIREVSTGMQAMLLKNKKYFISSDSDIFKDHICKNNKNFKTIYKCEYGWLGNYTLNCNKEETLSLLPDNIIEKNLTVDGIREILALLEMLVISMSNRVINPVCDTFGAPSMFLWYPNIIHKVPLWEWIATIRPRSFYDDIVNDPTKASVGMYSETPWRVSIFNNYGSVVFGYETNL